MVYVDPKNLGYEPFWTKWSNSRTTKVEKDNLQRLYEKYVPTLIDMVIEGVVDGRQGEKMKTIIPLTNLNLVSMNNYSKLNMSACISSCMGFFVCCLFCFFIILVHLPCSRR
jgi:dynein heavy chain